MLDSLNIKIEYMFALEDVAREVAEKILAYKGQVYDTRHIRGHEESSIDTLAYEWMHGSLENNLARFSDDVRFKGKYLFELHELQDVESREQKESEINKKNVLRIDEIDGTTNTKRSKASIFNYAPAACVCIALCGEVGMGSITIGVNYDLQNMVIFSGIKIEGTYMAFCDRKLLDPKDFEDKQGDTSTRIMVVGYSNRDRVKKAEIEKAILDADETKKNFRIYDGSRSTAMDILNILRNQYDAYIDPRALWPGSGAMLYPYDISAMIPVAYGCGLEISDIHGNSIENYSIKNEPLTIIVARKRLKDKFVEILKPVINKER